MIKPQLFILLILALLPSAGWCYSYASPQSDPLIVQRAAFLNGVKSGDWAKAQQAYQKFHPDLVLLSKTDPKDPAYPGDPQLLNRFKQALAKKDAKAAQQALRQAYVDQIHRRLLGVKKNIHQFQTAKTLLVSAKTFYQAMAGTVKGQSHQAIQKAFQQAISAIGKPGVFGYGQQLAKPKAFDQAMTTILQQLKT